MTNSEIYIVIKMFTCSIIMYIPSSDYMQYCIVYMYLKVMVYQQASFAITGSDSSYVLTSI